MDRRLRLTSSPLRAIVAVAVALLLPVVATTPRPAAAAAGDPAVVQVSAGQETTCELLANGFVRCWGANDYGQTSSAVLGDTIEPVEVAGLADVVEVSVGSIATCALSADGRVRCWGYNGDGRIGNTGPDTNVPTLVSGLSGVVDIDTGTIATCVVVTGGSVQCFGNDSGGGLGDPNLTDGFSASPRTVEGVNGATAVSVGSGGACALVDDGTVMCWGEGYVNGRTFSSPEAAPISGIDDATAVAVGSSSACVVRSGDQVSCWGYNTFGALGADPETTSQTETPVTTTHAGVVSIDIGATTVCAVVAGGAVECWGWNSTGAAGNGTTDSSHLPTTVTGLSSATAVSVGGGSACALVDGSTTCWGSNSVGQLRAPRADKSPWPDPVGIPDGVVALDVGVNAGCAVVESTVPADDGVWCWGANNFGQRGNGTTSATPSPIPTKVDGLADAIDVEVGFAFACALLSTDGVVSCWGSDSKGALGNGSGGSSTTPTPVSGVIGAAELAVGTENACVRYPTGTVWCWGSASAVGAGDGLTHRDSPVQIGSLSDVRSIDVNGYNGCAVTNTDDAYCWGNRASGQLGNGVASPGTIIAPVQVTVAGDIASISTSGTHTCAIETDADLVCFGSDNVGQIGNGPASSTAVPEGFVVPGIGGTAQVATGGSHTCAVSTTGTVHCFGRNDDGELGDGTYTGAPSPVASPSVTAPTQIAAGGSSTCLIVDDAPFCVGRNDKGQLGNNGLEMSLAPRPVDPLVLPATPSGVALTSGDRSLVLTFSAPAAVPGAAVADYVVQLRALGTTPWTTVADGVSTATSASLTGLMNGTTYQVRVAARSASYTGSFTAPVARSAGTPPSAPRSLRAAPADGSVRLSWSAPTTAAATVTDYIVQFRRAGSTTWATFADGVRTSRTATVKRLTNGTTYEFRVIAKNAVGQSPVSSTASTTPRTTPSAPRRLGAAPGRGSADLSWRAPAADGGASITDYTVQFRRVGARSWTTFADGTSASTTAKVTGLAARTNYEVRVRAVNAAGPGAWTAPVRVTPR